MKAVRVLAALVLACTALAAQAQYVWTDKTGHKVFSDRPPPMDVPESSILRQPNRGTKPMAADVAPSPVPPPQAAAAKPPARDGELEERRRQAESAEAAKRLAEENKNAALRADNCQRARQSAASLDSGVRLAQVNAQGERSFMDDQTRASESQRAQSIIASDCR